MNANICHKTFADINIDDIFFQSLKEKALKMLLFSMMRMETYQVFYT